MVILVSKFSIENFCRAFDLCFAGGETIDWTYAQLELLEKQGIDLRKEMEVR